MDPHWLLSSDWLFKSICFGTRGLHQQIRALLVSETKNVFHAVIKLNFNLIFHYSSQTTL